MKVFETSVVLATIGEVDFSVKPPKCLLVVDSFKQNLNSVGFLGLAN